MPFPSSPLRLPRLTLSLSCGPGTLFLTVLLALLLTAGCSGLGGEPRIIATQVPPTPGPEDVGYPLEPPDLALGAALFAENCTECHGTRGQGDGPLVLSGEVPEPPDFTDWATTWESLPTAWFEVITHGRIEDLMPPWGGALSEEERWAVTMYAYTLPYHAALLEQGEALYLAECAECHGETGRGDGPEVAELSRPVGDFTDQIEMVSLSDAAVYTIITEGQGEQMPAYADELTDEQRRAIVAHTRMLSLANKDAVFQEAGEDSQAADAGEVGVEGDIAGQIVSGTEGGTVPPDLPVTLYIIHQTPEGLTNEQLQTTADAEGRFTFEDVPIAPESRYITSTTYRERLFTGDLRTGAELAASPAMTLTIYELTEDPTVIAITDFNMQIDMVGDGLQILQEVVFRNTSDRMYTNSLRVGETNYASVVVGLPPGAVGLAFPNNAGRYVVGDQQGVVVDTIPVVPGEDHVVQFSYFLPYETGAVIEQPVYYEASGEARVLIPGGGPRLTGEQFVLNEEESDTLSVYQVYEAPLALEPGDTVRFELSGRPGAAASGAPASNTVFLLAIGLIVEVILVGLVVYWFLNRRKRRAGAAPLDREALKDGLIRQIAELDNLHAEGRIDDESYGRRRGQLKTRLAELMDQD